MDTKTIRKKPAKKRKLKKPTQKRRQWNNESMQNAIRAVKYQNLGYQAAANKYNVPTTSLFRLCLLNKEVTHEKIKPKLGRKPIFPLKLEEELVDHVLQMVRTRPNFTNFDVKRLAFQYAETNNIPNSFAKCKEAAGQRWLQNFKERHKDKLFIIKDNTDEENITTKCNEESMKTDVVREKETNIFNALETVLPPHEIDIIKRKFGLELVSSPELQKNIVENILTMEQTSQNEIKHITESQELEHKFNRHIMEKNSFTNHQKDKLLSNNIEIDEERDSLIKNLDTDIEMKIDMHCIRNINTVIINDETDDEIMEDMNMDIEEEIMKLKQNIEEERKWVEASIEDDITFVQANNSDQNNDLERTSILSRELEQQLDEQILIMQQKYSEYSKDDLKRVAFQVAASHNIFTKETTNKNTQDSADNHQEILPITKKSPLKNKKTPDKEINKRHTWDEDSMKLAIGAIKDRKMGYKVASDFFNVPKSTLYRLAAKVDYDSNAPVKVKLGRKQAFTPEEEEQLTEHLLVIEQAVNKNVKSLAKRKSNKKRCFSCVQCDNSDS